MPLLHARPFPLAGVPVDVVEEEIHQARLEQRAGVDALASVAVDQLPERVAVDDLEGAGKSLAVRGLSGREFDLAEPAGELLRVLAEDRVVRHHHELRRRVEDAGGLEQRGRDHRGGRMLGADLVTDDFRRERSLQSLGKVRKLVHRAERVFLSVPGLEAQRLRLHAATLLPGHEPAGEAMQVEHRNANGRGPEDAIILAEEEIVQAAGGVFTAGGDGHAIGTRDRRWRTDSGLRGEE